MGRVKSTLIKKTALHLAEDIEEFSNDFEHNKKLLGDTMPSKSIRNKVAGYIVRLSLQKKSAPPLVKEND